MNIQVLALAIWEAVSSILIDKILPLLGGLILVLILLLVGWLIAKGLQWVVVYVLKAIKLDLGSQKIGFTPLLTKGEIKRAPSDLLGDFVYWIVILITLISIASAIGLGSAEMILDTILSYVPPVFSAALMLGVGMFIAVVLSSLVLIIAANIGLANSKVLAKIVQYAVIIFAFIVSLGYFGIDIGKLIMGQGGVLLGAIALAFGIAFGLGCKDVASDFVTNLFKGK